MKASPAPIFIVAALLLLVALLGPVAAVIAAMSPGEAFAVFASIGAAPLRVSLLASAAATLAATVLGVPAGYFLSRLRPRGRAALLFLLALPLAFPPVASGLMVIYALGPNSALGGWLSGHGVIVTDSLLGVAIAEFFVSGSFVVIAATAAFSAIDPMYADAARTLGIGEWQIFTRIALPGAATGIGAGIAFAWLRAIGEYGATSIVAFHPTSLPVALDVALSASGVREALALCYGFVMLAAVALAIAWILRRGVVH
ncbi:MAG: ABC transporter permease subunit [Candidatus Eremiobacteraeota bacterium]|nr:ABC transporter permease subunit [Candidatus Eremiobacteraeota bacterium]MBV9263976.1 ABC transporter permease subunit [Candidatus Eremiobacteraeota bacterium]